MARWLNVLVGLWLVAAAHLLASEASPARIADLADGLALVAVSLLAPPGTAAGVASIVLGAWIMAAPSVLAYPAPASAMSDVLAGVLAIGFTLHPDVGPRRAARA